MGYGASGPDKGQALARSDSASNFRANDSCYHSWYFDPMVQQEKAVDQRLAGCNLGPDLIGHCGHHCCADGHSTKISTGFIDVLVTIIFLVASLLLGLAAAFLSAKEWSSRVRGAMVVIGLMGLVFWSGLIIGPLMAFLSAVVPHNMPRKSPSKR